MGGLMATSEQDAGRRIIAVLEKSAHDELIVDLQEYNGRTYLGVRIYDIHDGRRVPTTKGLTLPTDMLPALVRALNSAHVAAFGAPISAKFGEGEGHADGN